MAKLIVYYSLEGNTEYIANTIAEKTGAALLKLVPKKAYKDKGFAKFVWGGKSALMAERPELEPYTVDLSLYDEVIIGFPVWASTITPAIRTFVMENVDTLKEKTISAFACQSGSGAEKAFGKLQELIGNAEYKATAIFIDPKSRPTEKNSTKLEEFVGIIN